MIETLEEIQQKANIKPKTDPAQAGATMPLVLPESVEADLQTANTANIFEGSSQPFDVKPIQPVPSWSSTFWNSATKTASNIGTIVHNAGTVSNPFDDNVAPGWSATQDESYFVGVQPKDYQYVAESRSPNEATMRRFTAIQNRQDDDFYASGAMTAHVLGGFVDVAPTFLIPIASTLKYAQGGEFLVANMARQIPSIALGSAAINATEQAADISGNMQDFVLNTLIDTVGGTAFIGGTLGLSKQFDAFKLNGAKEWLKHSFNGINVDIDIQDGLVKGYKAVPAPGMSVGAADVRSAQFFLDGQMSQNGMFAIPYIGGMISKTVQTMNPIVRGLNSPFKTVRNYTNRTASHSIVTKDIEDGVSAPDNFDNVMGAIQGTNKTYQKQLNQLLNERNDISNDNPVTGWTEKIKKKWAKDGYIDHETFGAEVKDVILSGTPSEHGAVNKAAQLTREYLDEMWNAYRSVYNLPENWMPPPTSDGYFPRVYDVDKIMSQPKEWGDMWVDYLRTADSKIRTTMQPINELQTTVKQMKEQHDQLIRSKNVTQEQVKTSAAELAANERRLKKMKDDVSNRLREDPEFRLLTDDHSALSAKEAKELKDLHKPLRKAEKVRDEQKKVVESLKKDIFFQENKARKSQDKGTAKTRAKEVDNLKLQLEKEQTKLDEHEGNVFGEEQKLQDMAHNGQINPLYYERIPNSNQYKFKDPNNRLKMRDTFESEFHMRQHAQAVADTISNQTAEDTMTQVMGGYIGAKAESHVMKRSVMIPDTHIEKFGFTSNDLTSIVSNYRNSLGRKYAMKHVFGDVTIEGGIEPMVESLDLEYKNMRQSIMSARQKIDAAIEKIKLDKDLSQQEKVVRENKLKIDIAKNEKQLRKLNKEFEEAKKFMQLSYDRMMGRRSGKEANDFIKFMRLWTSATRLGAVPLTMVTDLGAVVMKHGLWPTIRDGLLPLLKNMDGIVKSGKGQAYIDNAAHAEMGLTHVMQGYNDRQWGGIAQQNVPVSGKINSFLDKAAHFSANVSGTNYIDNMLQRMTAWVFQSKLIKLMLDHEAGTLKESDKRRLLLYGIDPEQWSKRFLNGWRERGSDGNGFGGYVGRHWQWTDIEAANKFSNAMQRAVKDTIIRRGLMDSPFFQDDPVWQTIFYFKGWTNAATTRLLVPLMQTPDAQHLIGLTTMLAAGALVDPMRRLSRGESAIDPDETNMFWSAAQNSGVLSPGTDIAENMNIVLNGALLKHIKSDRYRDRSGFGAALGPVAGVGEDSGKVLSMLLSGNLNENDVKKGVRLIPGLQPWYTRGLVNKAVEALGLPKTAGDASRGNSSYR